MSLAQYDPEASQQILSLTSLSLTIGGQTFDLSDTVAGIQAEFQEGSLVGLTGTFRQPALGSLPFKQIHLGGDGAVIPTETVPIAAESTSASITIDFTMITIPAQGAYEFVVTVTLSDNTTKIVTIEVNAGATPQNVRNAVKTALQGAGIVVTPDGEQALTVQGTSTLQLKKLEFAKLGVGGPFVGPTKVTRTRYGNDPVPEYVPGTLP